MRNRTVASVAATLVAAGSLGLVLPNTAQAYSAGETELEASAPSQRLDETAVLEAADEKAMAAVTRALGKTRRLDRDEQLAAVADKLPGFAGYQTTTSGRVRVMLTRASGLLGSGGMTSWRATAGASGDFARALGSDAEIASARFDARQLLTVKEGARAHLARRGAHATWIDYAENRVYVGYDPELTTEEVQALADSVQPVGTLRQALVLVPMTRAQARLTLNKSIRKQVQPLAGGSQFQFNASDGAAYNCTVGVPAKRGGVLGFVTASHCTNSTFDYSVPSSADAPVLGDKYLGVELADPNGATNCYAEDPVIPCRFADAAFYSVGSGANSVELGKIALTDSALTVTGSIAVGGTASGAAVGTTVWKTGRTTGTTSGKVARLCVDTLINVPGPKIVDVRCSSEVDQTGFESSGDSGAAIWVKKNNRATIVGVLSYGRDNLVAGFSPWSAVTSELGPLTVK